MPRPENGAVYKRYAALAEATPGVHFVGRLASYKYYNMDQVVVQALSVFDKLVKSRRIVVSDAAPDLVAPRAGAVAGAASEFAPIASATATTDATASDDVTTGRVAT